MVEIPVLECLKCGHKWVPRVSDVRVCPDCHSLRWDRDDDKTVIE